MSEKKRAFLDTLRFILNDESYRDAIHWTSKGESFQVKNVKKLTQEILPKFFKHNNFSSFHRQLNLYGFTRDWKNKSDKVFCHPLFHRNKPELEDQIQKKSVLEGQMNLYVDDNNDEEAKFYVIVKNLEERNNEIDEKLENVNSFMAKVLTDHEIYKTEIEKQSKVVKSVHDFIMDHAASLKKSSFVEQLKQKPGNSPKNSPRNLEYFCF